MRGLRNVDLVIGDNSDHLWEDRAVNPPELDRPLHLDTFILRIRSESSAQNLYKWLPPASDLAAALLAIGGPLCQYRLSLEWAPGFDDAYVKRSRRLTDYEAVSSMYNYLVNEEIQKLIFPRDAAPGWTMKTKKRLKRKKVLSL
jgi:hypothetical protein